MMKRAVSFFRIGASLQIVTAGLHMIGHFSAREPANDTEAQLLHLMMNYRLDVGGVERTMMDLFQGFSLTFAALLVYVGLLNLMLVGHLRTNTKGFRAAALVNLVLTGVLVVVGALTFPVPPTALFALSGLAFLAALALGRTAAA